MTPDTPPPPVNKSWLPTRRTNRLVVALATIGALTVLAATTVVLHRMRIIDFDVLGIFTDSDEAPIRVRNGSVDMQIVSGSQKWENDNGEWKIKNTKRFKEEFEVTVAVRSGADCAPSHVATGAAVVVTFSDDTKVTFLSAGKRTRIKPSAGSLQKVNDQQLRYGTSGAGHIKQVAVGTPGSPTPICTFAQREQLDHIVILNVPQTP